MYFREWAKRKFEREVASRTLHICMCKRKFILPNVNQCFGGGLFEGAKLLIQIFTWPTFWIMNFSTMSKLKKKSKDLRRKNIQKYRPQSASLTVFTLHTNLNDFWMTV